MSSLWHKILLLQEIISTKHRMILKRIIWRKQGKGFKSFGENSTFEKPLYVRKKEYVSIGQNTIIKEGSRIQCDDFFAGKSLSPQMVIGDRCGIGYHFTVFVYDTVVIGDDVSIADNVMITSENHGMNPELDIPYGRQTLKVAPVTIGNGVWLSHNVSVMPGVTIGENSIIGANSVVTHDIPPFSIAVGTPARVIKKWNTVTHRWEKQ